MDDSTSLLLQRAAILRSQLQREPLPAATGTIEHLLADLERALETADAEILALAREKERLIRQNREMVAGGNALARQKEVLERQKETSERQVKTLERHNTNLLRQNTQLERHNAALDESRRNGDMHRRYYQSLFNIAPDAFLITDTSGEIVEANVAAAAMLNADEHMLKGDNLMNYINPPHRKLFITLLTRLQRIQDVELSIHPREMPQVATSLTLSTITDAAGRPTLLYWMLRDITERHESVAALNASERRFRTIFNEAMMGILLLDREGRVVRANRAMQDLLGYSEDELTGRPLAELTCPDDAPLTNTWLTLDEDSGAPPRLHVVENRFKRRDGQYFWTSVSLSTLRADGGTGYSGVPTDPLGAVIGKSSASVVKQPTYLLAMVKDISTEKQADAELTELRRRLVESGEVERLRLAQELHDGPTQDLYAAAFRAANFADQAADAGTQANLNELQGMLKSIANTLRDIVAELRPPTIANLGLERAIRSDAARVQELHPELEIRLHLASDGRRLPPHTRMALFRIYQQCISNTLRHAQASQIVVSFRMEDLAISLDIWDNGKGFIMPEKMMDLMREGHYGLAGIAERAQAMGGTLTVESRPGAGTLVRVTANGRSAGD